MQNKSHIQLLQICVRVLDAYGVLMAEVNNMRALCCNTLQFPTAYYSGNGNTKINNVRLKNATLTCLL